MRCRSWKVNKPRPVFVRLLSLVMSQQHKLFVLHCAAVIGYSKAPTTSLRDQCSSPCLLPYWMPSSSFAPVLWSAILQRAVLLGFPLALSCRCLYGAQSSAGSFPSRFGFHCCWYLQRHGCYRSIRQEACQTWHSGLSPAVNPNKGFDIPIASTQCVGTKEPFRCERDLQALSGPSVNTISSFMFHCLSEVPLQSPLFVFLLAVAIVLQIEYISCLSAPLSPCRFCIARVRHLHINLLLGRSEKSRFSSQNTTQLVCSHVVSRTTRPSSARNIHQADRWYRN